MKKLIFFGLFSFLLAVIWFTPLAYIAPYISKVTNDVTLQEPSGTIWNGQVNNLIVKNHALGRANWRINFFKSLKSLSLKTNFTLKGNDIKASGLAGFTIKKNLILDNTQFDITATLFNLFQSNATLSGNFNGFIKHALLIQNLVPTIDGIINWQNGAVTMHVKEWGLLGNLKLEEGDYRVTMKPEGQNLDIQLTSKEAPIELNGDIKLQKDWNFVTNLTAKSSNTGYMAMIKYAGKPQADGSILIKQKGDLKPFIGIN